jgi:hypothetical protein
MQKPNPYSPLELRSKLRPEWGSNIQKLAEGKKVRPLQFRFFVDGYNFYVGCKREVKRQEKYVRSLYEEWAEHPAPPTPINAGVLAATGRELMRNAEAEILANILDTELEATNTKSLRVTEADINAESFDFGVSEKNPFVLASNIAISALNKGSPSELERIDAASVVIDPYYILDFYAGGKPDIERMKTDLWFQRKKGKIKTVQLEEGLKLLNEGKFKRGGNKVTDLNEYQKFVESFNDSRPLDQVHHAITRFDHIEGGTFKLSEKGVDAKLMLGLFDALEENNVDAICLFSNDGDYYPILERIKEVQPSLPVFVASLGDVKRVSRPLKEAVGEKFIIDVKSRRLPWPEISESKEFEYAQYNRIIEKYYSELDAEYELIRKDMDRHFNDESNLE